MILLTFLLGWVLMKILWKVILFSTGFSSFNCSNCIEICTYSSQYLENHIHTVLHDTLPVASEEDASSWCYLWRNPWFWFQITFYVEFWETLRRENRTKIWRENSRRILIFRPNAFRGLKFIQIQIIGHIINYCYYQFFLLINISKDDIWSLGKR